MSLQKSKIEIDATVMKYIWSAIIILVLALIWSYLLSKGINGSITSGVFGLITLIIGWVTGMQHEKKKQS